MTESRLVKCSDPECGNEWMSSAKDPRCSDPDEVCGRSRASPVEDTNTKSGDDTVSDTDTTVDTDGDTSGRTPIFETVTKRTGTDPDRPDRRDTADDESDDGDDDDVDPSEFPELEPEDVRPFLVTAFGGPPEKGDDPIPGYASQQRGEHWAMKDHELDQLSRAYARVGNKYLPYIMAEYTVEGMALFATAMVVMPRIQEDRRRAAKRKKAEKDTRSNAGNVRSDTSTESDQETSTPIEEVAQDDETSGWQAGANA